MTDETVVRTHSPVNTSWGWSANLTRSIVLKDGTRLATLGDVRTFILKQPEHIQERGVNRLPNLTPDRRPILTPLSAVFGR